MLVIYFNCMSHYVDFNACFFRGGFSANECSSDIGLNDSARAIRGKFTFAGSWEGFWGIRTICKQDVRCYNANILDLLVFNVLLQTKNMQCASSALIFNSEKKDTNGK